MPWESAALFAVLLVLVGFGALASRWLRKPLFRSREARTLRYGISDIYVVVVQVSVVSACALRDGPDLRDGLFALFYAILMVLIWCSGIRDASAHPRMSIMGRLLWLGFGMPAAYIAPVLGVVLLLLTIGGGPHAGPAAGVFTICGFSCIAVRAVAENIAAAQRDDPESAHQSGQSP